MNANSTNYDVIIAGGGPAGASAAIHLAKRGTRVLLVETKKFPRPKLCGEFISPECAVHFERLGVADEMRAAHPAALIGTVFYSRGGKSVRVPSSWFASAGVALGLSRAEMDERLLRRAAAAGADVLEEAHATNVIVDNNAVCGVSVKHGLRETTYRAAVTIDATGRNQTLTRKLNKRPARHEPRPMVAFKAHFETTKIEPGACEIYFYRGGYGGLSSIENGLSNLCFIAFARDVRACDADADRVMREVVCQNRRAALTLEHARLNSPWLAVSLEGFGRTSVAPRNGLLAIGDAASFIDPFTGSGMLMALQSGELAAQTIGDFLDQKMNALDALRNAYTTRYHQAFHSRLRLCSWLRRAAFVPGLAAAAIHIFDSSDAMRRRLAQATRGGAETSTV
ncbi:MAG TPA: FAD-dependent oxidoreductase [Pyrinomonadaceae bacterium]|nr:FAD-dependent oxidoreductase [Pyrinomonadaceae bacterium]